ncbi:similar to integral membrane protein [Botrytis cinerea T4]|uniref:Similar to integral membrane protein n=1 Tax=Botryotinia fuckeliana (strain T4) TaxID=999810 RepID=G2YF84_BOTF4|nr:similar to integral membrane protein [Botrytis cinerea T4]
MKFPNITTSFAVISVLRDLACVSALAVFAPSDGPVYSLGLPSTTVSAGTGNIYFQLSAPDTYQWAALGIGRTMAGAYMYIMYSDGNGNVTISARAGGQGHVEPKVTGGPGSQVQLLEGSGITGGVMRANVLCTNCPLPSTTSTASPWIAAWNLGSPIDSTSTSYAIKQHGDSSYRQFTYDLTTAVIESDENPFLSNGTIPSTSGSGSEERGISASTLDAYSIAHGTIMSVTMVILFPLGAMLMTMFGKWWIHAAFQTFSLVMLIVGFGLGVKLAMFKDYLFRNQGKAHTSFGLALFVLLIIQAIVGLIHHLVYRKQHVRGFLGYMHIWYGRSLLILGIICGVLGLKLARNTKGGEIVYGILAGLVAMSYFTTLVLRNMGKSVGNKEIRSGSGKEGRNVEEIIPMKGGILATAKHDSERFPATSRS